MYLLHVQVARTPTMLLPFALWVSVQIATGCRMRGDEDDNMQVSWESGGE
jgi:hypothetical protein